MTTNALEVVVHEGGVEKLVPAVGDSITHLHIEASSKGGPNRKSLESLMDEREGRQFTVVVTGAEALSHADQRYLLTTKGLPRIVLVVNRDPSELVQNSLYPVDDHSRKPWMRSFYQSTRTFEARTQPEPAPTRTTDRPPPRQRVSGTVAIIA